LHSEARLPVDIYGTPGGSTGWATLSVEFARALDRLTEVRFRAKDRDLVRALLLESGRSMMWRGLTRPPAPFGVAVTGNPVHGQRSAQWILWETTVLPDAIRKKCETADFLWAPSSWGSQMLRANGFPAERLAIVPLGVNIDFLRPAERHRGGPFRFLFVGKWETRKFVDGLVRAFANEFSPEEPVELVLHAHNPYRSGFSASAELQRLGIASARVKISERASRRALRELYQSADCFVCPTRAEGWGLPVLEAMACGIPAIVTRYSAPTDFVTDDNGYLLDYELVDAHCDIFDIHTGQWAEPDVAHLRRLMRQTVEDPATRKRKGIQARLDAEKWSWSHAAEIAMQAIRRHALT
jgi:glycosyltransferase involved in cell wall biosynthesis